jgi:3-phytase/alkaline phosphatase D
LVCGILCLVFAALATAQTAIHNKGKAIRSVRFATFNASLHRSTVGQLASDLAGPGSGQPDVIAEIIQRVRPDVLLVNEFDFDPEGLAAGRFQENYLAVPHGDARPIVYPYRFVAPSNTGIASGLDLDNDGSVVGPGDAFGFGLFPGQYGMVVYSMLPIDTERARTFQYFLWKDMPDALLPVDPATGESWYSDEELAVFRLSSKSHWDIPIRLPEGARAADKAATTVHFLVSHPTPPVFDALEDRNGKRNHDEIRFWADYIVPSQSDYIYDDAGRRGGLGEGALFVIAGDQNADPFDGDSVKGAAQQLLDHPLVNTTATPKSPGGTEAARLQGGSNRGHVGDPACDTADFGEAGTDGTGNLRVDYVLPGTRLRIVDAGVFWPSSDDPVFHLVGDSPGPGSDHRLVWIDVAVPAP